MYIYYIIDRHPISSVIALHNNFINLRLNGFIQHHTRKAIGFPPIVFAFGNRNPLSLRTLIRSHFKERGATTKTVRPSDRQQNKLTLIAAVEIRVIISYSFVSSQDL